MIGLKEDQLAQLIGMGECYIHTHPKELLTFEDRLALAAAEPVFTVTGDFTPTRDTELLQVDTSTTSITITLPLADRGREFQIIKTSEKNALYVVTSGSNTITGSSTGLVVYNKYSSLHLKSVAGGYLLL